MIQTNHIGAEMQSRERDYQTKTIYSDFVNYGKDEQPSSLA